MSEFEREQPSYRIAQTRYGDSLQDVAAREIGDANKWPELIWLNDLQPPYLTDDPAQVSTSVLLAGSIIKVPAPVGVANPSANPNQIYERDCLLKRKMLQADGSGDLMIVTGTKNLKQQLEHAIATPKGQAQRHSEYGCMAHHLIGKVTGSPTTMLGAEYVKSTLEADYRISSVLYAEVEVVGDVVNITAAAESISGAKVDVVT
jgi:phage baseplate assembly protein W